MRSPRLQAGLVAIYRDHRTRKALTYKRHVELLSAQYRPGSDFLRELTSQVARMRVGRDEAAAAVDEEVARQDAQPAPRGRDKAEAYRARGRKALTALRKRWALERDSCQRAEDRLAGLCAEQGKTDIAQWYRAQYRERAEVGA